MTSAIANRNRVTLAAGWSLLILSETLAQVALKAGGEALAGIPFGHAWVTAALGNGWILLGSLGYLGSFAAWMAVLDRTPLSLGFPLTAVVYLTVGMASVFVFGERLEPSRIIGLLVIVTGIVLLGLDER